MSTEEQIPVAAVEDTKTTTTSETNVAAIAATAAITTDPLVEQERAEKILKAKELYNHGSRNFLVKSYAEAADELSQVCGLYEELYGEQSDELGMPYLLYAKSLIALALDENKVIDVPDEEELEDDDGEGDEEAAVEESVATLNSNGAAEPSSSAAANGAADKDKLVAIKEQGDEVDSTAGEAVAAVPIVTVAAEEKEASPAENITAVTAMGEKATALDENTAAPKSAEDAQVSSTDEEAAEGKKAVVKNGAANNNLAATVVDEKVTAQIAAPSVLDGEKPSTSNGDTAGGVDEEEEENEAASNLQLAWEILELAAKIFLRQGASGRPNLAEVQTELGNIEFENNIPESARDDYEVALKIYSELPTNYRRAMAEIHYKIGLTYLMQQLNKEGAESLRDACTLIDAEIQEIRAKDEELTEKEKNNIQDMEETKQEIWAKIAEIEDTQAQNIAEVRAALDSYIKPISSDNADGAGPSLSSSSAGASSTSAISSTKPTNISHLIKRKKPDEQSSEAEAASPAKRPAL